MNIAIWEIDLMNYNLDMTIIENGIFAKVENPQLKILARIEIGVKPEQQDRIVVKDGIIAVLDGVSLPSMGSEAAQAAAEFIEQNNFEGFECIDAYLAHLNAKVMETNGHTCLTLVQIKEDMVNIWTIGDTKAYLIKDGEMIVKTAIHSGLINSSLSNAIGRHYNSKDIFHYPIHREIIDRIVVCSDGVYNFVPEFERMLGDDPINLISQIKNADDAGYIRDNWSIVIIDF